MFETSVVQGPQRVATTRFSLLTISIIAHSAVLVGAVLMSVATVEFPAFSPDAFAQAPVLLPMLQPPPPLGVHNGGAPRPPEQPRAIVPPVVHAPDPSQAPSTVSEPEAQDQPAVADDGGPGGNNPNATSTLPVGDPLGDRNSVAPFDGTVNPGVAGPAERIYEASEVKAPVSLYRPAPAYPTVLIKTKLKATVVVRCVIDKNGHVRDPRVTVAASMSPFNEAVLTAVRQWRFTPGSLNGQAVETYLDLTVKFAVN